MNHTNQMAEIFLNIGAFKIDDMVAGEIRFWRLPEAKNMGRPYLCCPRCSEVMSLSGHEFELNEDQTEITISPSIGHAGTCKAHFFVKKNKITWVSDLP